MGINDMKSKQHSSLKSSHPKLMHMFKALLQVLILESWSFIYMLLEKIDKVNFNALHVLDVRVLPIHMWSWMIQPLCQIWQFFSLLLVFKRHYKIENMTMD
jgi:hypothetical protein